MQDWESDVSVALSKANAIKPRLLWAQRNGRYRIMLNIRFLACVVLCSVATIAAAGPSFDCSKASLPDEFAICASQELSELDNVIAAGYAFLRASTGNDNARQVGLPLLRMRQACQGNVSCIRDRQIDAIKAYQQAGAPISLPAWAIPSPQTSQPTIVQNVTNVTVQNSITTLQADLDAKATSAAVLMELINQQRTLSESGSDISLFALTVLEQLGGELNEAIQDLQAEAQSQYGTPVRPNNGNNDLSARERSKNFPPVPYYVAGQEGNGEFWLEPLVKDTGELVYRLNFIDPEEQNERITSNFELSLNELSQIRTALDTVYEWSETAQSNRIRRRYEKTAVCFPAVQCEQKVQGNTSTQVDFLIYEDGATGARIIRNKGAFVEPYNMSIESVALLAAYLDYVAAAAEAEFNAGTATEESLDALFE